jgi:hypothetical protein
LTHLAGCHGDDELVASSVRQQQLQTGAPLPSRFKGDRPAAVNESVEGLLVSTERLGWPVEGGGTCCRGRPNAVSFTTTDRTNLAPPAICKSPRNRTRFAASSGMAS